MQSLNATDGRIGLVVPGELLEPFVLDGVAGSFGNLTQGQLALGKQLSGSGE